MLCLLRALPVDFEGLIFEVFEILIRRGRTALAVLSIVEGKEGTEQEDEVLLLHKGR